MLCSCALILTNCFSIHSFTNFLLIYLTVVDLNTKLNNFFKNLYWLNIILYNFNNADARPSKLKISSIRGERNSLNFVKTKYLEYGEGWFNLNGFVITWSKIEFHLNLLYFYLFIYCIQCVKKIFNLLCLSLLLWVID